jgi:uncharacterized membrane protein
MVALRRRWLVLGFLICAAPVGLLAAWLTPAMQVPDEAAHTVRAAGLLHGAVLARRVWAPDELMGNEGWEAGLRASVPLMSVALSRDRHGPLRADAPRRRFNLRRMFFFYVPNTAMYFPAAYVPAALGMALVAACHGGAAAGFVGGRIGQLLAYLALGAAALRLAAYGEAVLLAVLLLPLPVLLAGSFNQDAVLVALTCAGVAALTRPQAGWRLAGLTALTLLAAAKPPYALLMGLYVLPLSAPGLARRLLALAGAWGAVGLWVAMMAASVIVPFDIVSQDGMHAVFYHPGPLYTGDPAAWLYLTDPAAQLAGLLANPPAIVGVLVRTFAAMQWRMAYDLIGRFGRLELPVGWWLGLLWGLAMLAALAGGGRVPGQRRAGLAAWGLIAGSLIAVMLSIYLDNTPVGSLTVVGFFPRYLLPLAPCLVLALPARQGAGWAVAAVLALGLFDLAYLPALLWRTYGGG